MNTESYFNEDVSPPIDAPNSQAKHRHKCTAEGLELFRGLRSEKVYTHDGVCEHDYEFRLITRP